MADLENVEYEFQIRGIDVEIQRIEAEIARLYFEKDQLNFQKIMLSSNYNEYIVNKNTAFEVKESEEIKPKYTITEDNSELEEKLDKLKTRRLKS